MIKQSYKDSADDVALFDRTATGVEEFASTVGREGGKLGLRINANKTKLTCMEEMHQKTTTCVGHDAIVSFMSHP